jgi:hypothetical protein
MQNGMAERINPDSPMSPRKFTLYRLRDHAKTVISDQGFSDYSEWFLAHSGSTYYQQTDKKRAEISAKVESSLTYLDTLALEGKRAHMETRLEQQQDDYRRVVDELRLERDQRQQLEQDLGQAEGQVAMMQEEWEQEQKERQEFKQRQDEQMRQLAETVQESTQAFVELRDMMEKKLLQREQQQKKKKV